MSNSSETSVSIFIIIAIIAGGVMCNLFKSSSNPDIAEKEFYKWSKEFGIETLHVKCNSLDSDNDGYVSCTYTIKEEREPDINGNCDHNFRKKKDVCIGSNGEIHQIECAAAYNLQHGCRLPKIKLNQ